MFIYVALEVVSVIMSACCLTMPSLLSFTLEHSGAVLHRVSRWLSNVLIIKWTWEIKKFVIPVFSCSVLLFLWLFCETVHSVYHKVTNNTFECGEWCVIMTGCEIYLHLTGKVDEFSRTYSRYGHELRHRSNTRSCFTSHSHLMTLTTQAIYHLQYMSDIITVWLFRSTSRYNKVTEPLPSTLVHQSQVLWSYAMQGERLERQTSNTGK